VTTLQGLSRTASSIVGGRVALAGFCAAIAVGCAPATVNPHDVQATQTAPVSTQVEVVRIPYDPAYKKYVVTVEPLSFDADPSGAGSAPAAPGRRYGWTIWGWGLLPEGPQAQAYTPPPQGAGGNVGGAIAAQLVTALSNSGNMIVIDYDYYLENKGRASKLADAKKGELGPFVIRGSVTEFNEIAQASGQSSGGSLGAVGVALGVAGAIAGNAPAAYTGAGLAAANPTYENTVARRTGSVAMDLKVVNPGNGRIVGTMVANGSFTAESAANGFSLFGFGKASNAFAASALGQANRAAMNSATTQITDRLKAADG
jgi:curli biogenesis system outer membrane secretion channel CsgG